MPELGGAENGLREGLRALSESCPREAPPWVQERLLAAFRRHHSTRRRRRILRLTAMAAALVLAAGLMIVRERPLPSSAGSVAAGLPGTETPSPHSTSQPFIPVLYGQRPPAEGPAIVVRLEMPASDLRLVGVPVDEEVANRTVQAEVVIGADGLPYALRVLSNNASSSGVEP